MLLNKFILFELISLRHTSLHLADLLVLGVAFGAGDLFPNLNQALASEEDSLLFNYSM